MSKYDDALNALETEGAEKRAAAGIASSAYQPDAYAKALDLSRETGAPATIVARDPKPFEERAYRSKYDAALDGAPALSTFLESTDNHAVARDDVENLSLLEKAIRKITTKAKTAAVGATLIEKQFLSPLEIAREIPSGFVQGTGMALSGAGRVLEMGGRATEKVVRAAGGDWLADLQTDYTPGGYLRGIGEPLERAAQAIQTPQERRTLITEGVQGVGQIGSQALIQALMGPVGSTISLFSQGADVVGDRADIVIAGAREAGATPEELASLQAKADVAGALGAAWTALTEKYQLDELMNRAPLSVRSKFMSEVGDFLLAGLGEGVQEATEAIGHDTLAKFTFDPTTQIGGSATEEGAAAFISGALSRLVMNAIIPGRGAAFTDDHRAVAEEINTIVAQSKLAQRSPQKVEELVAEIHNQTGSDTAYIDAGAFRTLFQSDQEAAQAAAEMTGSQTSYFEAAVSGAKIAVPLEKYVARIATSKDASKLVDHITFTPDGLTATEVQSSLEGFDERVQSLAESMQSDAAADTSQGIFDDVVGQLLATGMERSTAEKNALLTQSVFRTLAQRVGMDPMALYDKSGLKIQRESIEGGTQYSQSANPQIDTPEFKAWFGDSKVADEAGRPMVVYHGTTGDVQQFDVSRRGENTSAESAGMGFFFTDDAVTADSYANYAATDAKIAALLKEAEIAERRGDWDAYDAKVVEYEMLDASFTEPQNRLAGQNTLPVYLAIKNPLRVDAAGENAVGFDIPRAIRKAISGKHDGLIIENLDDAAGLTNRPATHYVVFKPTQIKSAVGNRGTFDPNSDSILEQRFEETKRGAITFGPDRRFTISLLEKADLSTFLHESGHLYLELLGDLAEQADAPQQIKDDYATTLKWLGVKDRASVGVDQHEQWARGFEAYLMEGKAPTVELQTVFARFRAWLVGVYRTLKKLNVELTDEVRKVMDRLVATDSEILAAEESQNYAPIFATAEEAGMSLEEWAVYKDIAARAHQEATTDLADRAMKQLTREQKAWWKEEREATIKTVTDEVNAMPVYKALAFLQRGQNPDGSALPEGVTPAKLSKQNLLDTYGKDFLKRLPRGVYSVEGGISPDIAAQMFEFPSGTALVEALATARPKKQLIEMEADARLREKYGDMMTDGSLADEAMQAVHTEGRDKVLSAELKALNRKRREVKPFVKAATDAKTRERRQAREANPLPAGDELKVIKAAVERIIATKKVRDIKPNVYRVAESQAAKAAFDFAAKGKYEDAYTQKRRQILNHELYRAAVKAQEEIESIADYMRGFDKRASRERLGKAGGQYLEQIDAIRERFDFSRISNIASQKRMALAQWVEEKRAAGLEVVIPDYVLNETRRVPYKELMLWELQGIRDSVKNIDHLSRFKNKLLASAKKRGFDETVLGIVESIDDNHKRTAEVVDFAPRFGAKLKKGMKRYFAEHTKMEFLFTWLDGEKNLGPTWEALFKPVADAENVEQAKMRDARKAMAGIFGKYSRSELNRMFVGKTYVPEVGKTFTKASLLSVALNSGNEYNREVLLRGYGWSESQLNAILSKLDNRDWDAVEAIWTHVDTYWPEISNLQEELTGLPPEKVEAMLFLAPNGRQIRGGYYPLKYDAETSERQNKQDEAQSVTEMFGGNFARIATKQGHTKARTDSGGKKVKLDLGVYTEHVTNVIHDLAFRRAVLDVDRIIQDGRTEQAIIETAGREMYRQLRPWLRNIAGDYRQPMNSVERILNHARAGASIVSMGFKITTAVVQPLGYLQTVEMIGAKYAGIGLKEFYGKGLGMAKAKDFVMERSEQMRNRMTTFDRDVRDQLKGLQDKSHDVRRAFFYLTGMMDMSVAIPSWLGAYRKAMDGAVDGLAAGDELAAIDFADSMVRKSQSAGGAKDLAGIQAGTPLFKLFTTFYSYFNVMYNLMARRVGMTKSASDLPALAGSMMLLWFMPAILSELIAGRGPGDDDDWEEWFAHNAANFGLYPLQGLIGFREMVQAMGPYGYDGPPALDAISQTGRALKIPFKAVDDEAEVTRSDVRAAVEAASYWGHLPGRQMWITGEYLYDYMTGEEDEFSLKEAMLGRRK